MKLLDPTRTCKSLETSGHHWDFICEENISADLLAVCGVGVVVVEGAGESVTGSLFI